MSAMIARRIEGRSRDLGGFEVRRVLPAPRQRMVGPFIFFDQMGPASFAPGHGIDVRPHPHIGLATVTYLFEGALRHQDSLGVDAVIRPGDVNWMTAGRGVVHSERTPDPERADGHALYGIQTWVALPEGSEDIAPAFHHHPAASLPDFERDGARFRLILGTAWGQEAPVEVFSPIFYLHGALPAGSRVELDIEHEERAVYLVSGEATLDGEALQAGEMAVLTPGTTPTLAASVDSIVMLCGGAGLGERQIFWNFVASDADRLTQAKADWSDAGAAGFPADGRFTLPAGETEHIPLPE
ncbi:pirin family protein [Maricaulis sp.]|uniref:pirin family protein n=1 Tax=Maricaulis sp. TaxID=1486257 RepID=UPI003A91443A